MRRAVETEGVRKGIHLATVGIPIAIWFTPRSFWQWPLVIGTALVLIIELVRFGHPGFGALYHRILGPYMRRHEQDELMGSTYLTLSCLLCAFLLEKEIAVAVMGYLILGDGLAGLVGRAWGRVPVGFNKTLEGTLVGLLVNVGVGLLVLRDPAAALLGASVASAAEYLPVPLDDNFAIPLAAGLALSLTGM